MLSVSHDSSQERYYEAVILDLDGVLTETVSLHRRAWKETFDRLLEEIDSAQPPFDDRGEYRRYVDGKPRLDGARSFLAARGIELPQGETNDTFEDHTIQGIGNTKNARYLELLNEHGATVFDEAAERVRQWKRKGLPIAIVSGSRNCQTILESSGLTDLFDVRVDGETLDDLGMRGKPAPDMYLEAARRLGVPPEKTIVFEDAQAGVEAARQGEFGLVVGVGGEDVADELRRHGADLVVPSVGDFTIPETESVNHAACQTPCLLDSIDEMESRLRDHRPALFLDYDGTLTPIVERPELAQLDDAMRDVLRNLARDCTIAIVSGRDRDDVQQLVGLENIIFAGSHGFDIRGPDDLAIEHAVGDEAVPKLDAIEEDLHHALDSIDGSQIERKRFSIAVHYRNVNEEDVSRVEDAVDRETRNTSGLRKKHGKKVLEIQPDIDWNKGEAVLWLLEALALDRDEVLPIYIGDDLTDEDAFRALHDCGIGIVVEPDHRDSAADYCLHNVDEVRQFLEWMHAQLESASQ